MNTVCMTTWIGEGVFRLLSLDLQRFVDCRITSYRMCLLPITNALSRWEGCSWLAPSHTSLSKRDWLASKELYSMSIYSADHCMTPWAWMVTKFNRRDQNTKWYAGRRKSVEKVYLSAETLLELWITVPSRFSPLVPKSSRDKSMTGWPRIFVNEQHIFVKHRSTVSILLAFTNFVLIHDRIDFFKAFDIVDHNILFFQLSLLTFPVFY